jgi:UDP-glucuronate 4-epimerase
MAHSYAHLFGLPITMFRFFTVYGPWGRPDMALFKFTKAILSGEPIDVYNHGEMSRDFTYIDDLIHAIMYLLNEIPDHAKKISEKRKLLDSTSPVAPFRVVNIGNSTPVELIKYIKVLEEILGIPVKMNLMPMQSGDVKSTYADVSLLKALTDYTPTTSVEHGIKAFVQWYMCEYKTDVKTKI